jgi:hypothetical protein
MTNGRFPPPK